VPGELSLVFLRRLTIVLGDINLHRLVVFVAVVEAGSLTSGASRLGLAKAMVSTHMWRQEAELGASLVAADRKLTIKRG
jgi:DNA-binding transcriptional LysR family regulator